MVKELRKLCEEVETIKAEREVIENEIKEAKFDMSKSEIPQVLNAQHSSM